MRVVTTLTLSLCLVLSGCRKKSAPEFYLLEAEYASLTTNEGDAAWSSAEMASIVARLNAIGPDMLEKPRAQALVAQIAAEQARAQQARAAAPAVEAPPNVEARYAAFAAARSEEQRQEETRRAEAADAGRTPTEPWKGMSEAEFVKHFGDCHTPGGTVPLPGGRDASSQLVKSTDACIARFGTRGYETRWVFDTNGLDGKLTQQSSSERSTTIIDAGPPPPPPEPEAPSIVFLGTPTENPDSGVP